MTPSSRASAGESVTIEREIARLAATEEVRATVEWFRDQEAEFTRWQLELARIPAPPFGEAARADWLAERFRALGLLKVHKDSVGNVFGNDHRDSSSTISVSAHLDTVFPASTPLNIR